MDENTNREAVQPGQIGGPQTQGEGATDAPGAGDSSYGSTDFNRDLRAGSGTLDGEGDDDLGEANDSVAGNDTTEGAQVD